MQDSLKPFGHGYTPPSPAFIREVVELSGMTQKEIANHCGVHVTTVNRWMSESNNAKIRYAEWRIILCASNMILAP